MIPIPGDLYPDTHKIHINTPKLPPPSSFIAQFEQIRTEEQNRSDLIKRKESHLINHLSPIVEKLSQCELLAFDFAVFLDSTNSDQIQTLFQDCFSISDGHYKFNFADVKSVANHIRNLIKFIQTCETQFHQPDPSHGAHLYIAENSKLFHSYLKQCLTDSENLFRTLQDQLQNTPFSLQIPIDMTETVETDSKEFANWLLSQGRVSHSIQIKQLANRLAYRLTTIFNLQETVTRYRELSSICDTSKSTEFYSPDSIINSPEYQLITKKIIFFSHLLSTSKLDQINDFAYQLKHKLDNNWSTYESRIAWKYQDYLKDIQTYSSRIEENRKYLEDRIKQLTPMAQDFFANFGGRFSKGGSKYLTFAIPQTIDNLKRRFTDQNIVRKINQILRLNDDIEMVYNDGLKYIDKIMSIERQITEANVRFNVVDDNAQLAANRKLTDSMAQRMKNYLKQIHANNQELIETYSKIQSLADVENKIESNLLNCIEEFNNENESQVGNTSSEELENQREQLLQKIKEFDEKIVYLQKSVYDINEKRASLGQDTSQKSELATPVNQAYQNSFYQLQQKVICPACNFNRRNILIEQCGHVVCNTCFEKARQKRNPICPVCRKSYRSDEYDVL